MTVRAAPRVDVASHRQHSVGGAVGAEGNFGGLAGTRTEGEHGRDHESDANEHGGRGGGTHATDDTDPMGMDPTRPHRRRPADYVFVGATIIAGVLLLVWVFFGSA